MRPRSDGLHESLRRSVAQAKSGQLIDGDEVIDRLLGGASTAEASRGQCLSSR